MNFDRAIKTAINKEKKRSGDDQTRRGRALAIIRFAAQVTDGAGYGDQPSREYPPLPMRELEQELE